MKRRQQRMKLRYVTYLVPKLSSCQFVIIHKPSRVSSCP